MFYFFFKQQTANDMRNTDWSSDVCSSDLHDRVGAAQAAALAQARPGVPYEAGHQAVVETLTEGLLRLGLLKGKCEKNIADGSYKRFYLHKTGHWIGLDVRSEEHTS